MLDRKTPPTFQKSNSFALINPEKIKLSNGVRILFVNGGEQDVIKIEFIFRASKWNESQPGISYFTAHLLAKGTPTKSSYQISSELDQYGVHLEVIPGNDFTSLALYGLTKNIDQFFELIVDIITQPTFPESELQQAKDIYIQGLKINLEKTSYLASRLLRQNLFGKEHPYGRDAEVSDITNIEQIHLSSFHQAHYRNMDVICAGKINDGIKRNLATLSQNFMGSGSNENSIIKSVAQPTNEFLKKENSVQSSVRFGKRVINRTHPDYAALLLLNHILGGYFGSRLMKSIREEKGLTYGIHSSIATLKHDSYISIGTDVNNENREIVIQEIKNEMESIQTQLISITELETARNHFIGSLQAEITTPFAHADKIKNIMLNNLPDDFYQSLFNKIDSLNSADLIETAQKYFNEADYSVISVG